MKRFFPVLLLTLLAPCAFAYDANGVAPGASEEAILKQFPSSFCQPLQWKSEAADRRCDDAKALVGGVPGRITFYLKEDRVQAFDLRFDNRDAERLVAYLKKQYGRPAAETREKVEGKRGEVYKVHWRNGEERALVVSHDSRRAALSVSRGKFHDEIYRIR